VVESCTGGLIAHRLTGVEGSSVYFKGGVIAYSNSLKSQLLDVSTTTLRSQGAVSEDTAREMAQGVRCKCNADFGLSTTGIAGPSGGTPDKPVGTVWIAWADASQTITRKFQFAADRKGNKLLFSQAALNLLRLILTDQLK